MAIGAYKRIIASKDFEIFRFILLVFLGWKTIISFIAFFGLTVFPEHLGSSQTGWAPLETDYWLRWSNWDGGHFRGIAENGYLAFQVVFFPLYPMLIRALMFFGLPSLWSGLIISNLSIIGGLFYLYKLIALDFEEAVAKRAVFIILAFPTAFYFTAVYSESLFLFLAVASFYFARTKKWVFSLILASLASVVRLYGLVIILAVMIEYFLKTPIPPTFKQCWSSLVARFSVYLLGFAILGKLVENFFEAKQYYFLVGATQSTYSALAASSLLLILVFLGKFYREQIYYKKFLSWIFLISIFSLVPFISYCSYLYITQGNFLAFINHEQQWQRALTFPWSAPIEYFKNFSKIGFLRIDETSQQLMELLFFIFFSILLVISAAKLRISYTFYFAMAILIPIATGTLQAIHRYGLVIFPVFIILALIKGEVYYHLWLYFSLTLLGILTVLYINSYWVS